jgi:hypothetical protein
MMAASFQKKSNKPATALRHRVRSNEFTIAVRDFLVNRDIAITNAVSRTRAVCCYLKRSSFGYGKM